jgi:hypothetical protein
MHHCSRELTAVKIKTSCRRGPREIIVGSAYLTLDRGDRMDAIIVDFSKAFDLVLHGRLLVKVADSGVDNRVVVFIIFIIYLLPAIG